MGSLGRLRASSSSEMVWAAVKSAAGSATAAARVRRHVLIAGYMDYLHLYRRRKPQRSITRPIQAALGGSGVLGSIFSNRHGPVHGFRWHVMQMTLGLLRP